MIEEAKRSKAKAVGRQNQYPVELFGKANFEIGKAIAEGVHKGIYNTSLSLSSYTHCSFVIENVVKDLTELGYVVSFDTDKNLLSISWENA